MSPFERFTPNAKQALSIAEEESPVTQQAFESLAESASSGCRKG